MRWLFLVNNVDLMMEFLGKLSAQAMKEGDSCVLVFNSRMAEYRKKKFFPPNIASISKIGWLEQNYNQNYHISNEISWKEFFPTFERKAHLMHLDYETSVRITSKLHEFFEVVFTKEKPDIVIGTAPGNIFTNIAYSLCQKYRVVYLGVIGSKFTGKFDVYDKPHTLSLYEKEFSQIEDGSIANSEKEFADTFVEDFVSHKQLPPYMDFQFEFSALKGPARFIKRQIHLFPYFLRYMFSKKNPLIPDYESKAYVAYNMNQPIKSFTERIRKIAYRGKYKKMDASDQFFLYPLHFYPESSTLVQATYFSDQLNTIKNIAFSLPFPYKLYVKEHPIALGMRSGSFYRYLKKLPNVVLIKANENNKSIIQKSAGVITLTSTVGMEAALLGKPVYVLGDVFYEYHPLCKKVKSFEELRQVVQGDLVENKTIKGLGSINRRFILSYLKHTISGEVSNALKENDPNNYQEIYAGVRNIVKNI